MMNAGTLVPPAIAPAPSSSGRPSSTRSSRRTADAGVESKDDKEKRKAEKQRLKEEKKHEKALMKARMGLQGAAGEDEDEGEAEADAGEGSSGKRKADTAPVGTADEPAEKKSKGKAGKGKGKAKEAAPIPSAQILAMPSAPLANNADSTSASMDDEKLQELANAVLGGSIGVGVAAGSSSNMNQAQLDIAQRVQGIDDSAIDPALQELQEVERADMDAATLWHATRKAARAAEEAARQKAAEAKGKGKTPADINGGDLDELDDLDYGTDHLGSGIDPFGHAQTESDMGMASLLSEALQQHEQQHQLGYDGLHDSSSFDYALSTDPLAHAHAQGQALHTQTQGEGSGSGSNINAVGGDGNASGSAGADYTGKAAKALAAPTKRKRRRKDGEEPARRGRPPNPVGPDGIPLPRPVGAINGSADGHDPNADVTGFAAPPKRMRDSTGPVAKGPKDDELAAQFQTPGEMERFLADRWLPSQELIRLEQAGSEFFLPVF